MDILFSVMFFMISSMYFLPLLIVEYLSVKMLFFDLLIVMWKIQFVFNHGGDCLLGYITCFFQSNVTL